MKKREKFLSAFEKEKEDERKFNEVNDKIFSAISTEFEKEKNERRIIEFSIEITFAEFRKVIWLCKFIASNELLFKFVIPVGYEALYCENIDDLCSMAKGRTRRFWSNQKLIHIRNFAKMAGRFVLNVGMMNFIVRGMVMVL